MLTMPPDAMKGAPSSRQAIANKTSPPTSSYHRRDLVSLPNNEVFSIVSHVRTYRSGVSSAFFDFQIQSVTGMCNLPQESPSNSPKPSMLITSAPALRAVRAWRMVTHLWMTMQPPSLNILMYLLGSFPAVSMT